MNVEKVANALRGYGLPKTETVPDAMTKLPSASDMKTMAPTFAATPPGVRPPMIAPSPMTSGGPFTRSVGTTALGAPSPAMPGPENRPPSTAGTKNAAAFIRQKLREGGPAPKNLPDPPSLEPPKAPKPKKAFEPKPPPSPKRFRQGVTEGTT